MPGGGCVPGGGRYMTGGGYGTGGGGYLPIGTANALGTGAASIGVG